MSSQDDFEVRARELGEQFLSRAVDLDEQFIPRIIDELWNAFVAGQESIKRINEALPLEMPSTHGNPVHLHVERRGECSLMFAGRGEREIAFKILQQWALFMSTVAEVGNALQENGKALRGYGGQDAIEGRIREIVGAELYSLVSLLILRSDASTIDILLTDHEELFQRTEAQIARMVDEGITIDGQKVEEVKEALKNIDKGPQFDEDRAEAQRRLATLQEALRDVEESPCTQENVELRKRILDDMHRCKVTLDVTVYHSARRAQAIVEKRGAPQQETDLRVRITEHRGLLVIECLNPEHGIDQDGWYPKKPQRFGSSIEPTRSRLGISSQALRLMRRIPRNHDAVGDLMWNREGDVHRFTWWGPMFRVIDPRTSEASRDFRIWSDQYVEIPNDTPSEAIRWIEIHYGSTDTVAWREPVEVSG